MVPLIFEMLAKLSRCSNARAQIFEVLAKVEQSCSNARFLKQAKCSNARFFFRLSHFMLLTVVECILIYHARRPTTLSTLFHV